MSGPTHVKPDGTISMVDCSAKEPTDRTASASVVVNLNQKAFSQVVEGSSAKGNILTTAQLAGIQAAKNTSQLVPLCHPIPLTHAHIRFELDKSRHTLTIISSVRCHARTGAEMEALCACSVAALTVYDMLKAVQRDMTITDLRLLSKSGGKSGEFTRADS